MLEHTAVLVIVWVLWGVAFFTTACRAVLRFKVQGGYRSEDYFAATGFVFLTALTAVVTVVAPLSYTTQRYIVAMVTNPSGPLPLSPEEFAANTVKSLKLMFAQMLLFWTTLWAGKFSLLVFFRRMVVGLPRYLKWFWVVFGLVLLTYLGCVLSNFLTCVPLKKYWSPIGCSDPENVERADKSIRFATGADIAADFLIMLLPLKLLWNLQISRRQKIALASMFCLGLIVIVVAFVRLHNVTKATSTAQIDPTKMADGQLLLSLWSQIEGAVAVIVANLPAFRSLLRTGGTTTRPSKPTGGTYPSHSAGTGKSKHFGQSSITEIRNASLELQSFHSERSLYGSPTDLRDPSGIVRTTEFEIHSNRRSVEKADSERLHPFVPR